MRWPEVQCPRKRRRRLAVGVAQHSTVGHLPSPLVTIVKYVLLGTVAACGWVLLFVRTGTLVSADSCREASHTRNAAAVSMCCAVRKPSLYERSPQGTEYARKTRRFYTRR
jgi:hypothetical protein